MDFFDKNSNEDNINSNRNISDSKDNGDSNRSNGSNDVQAQNSCIYTDKSGNTKNSSRDSRQNNSQGSHRQVQYYSNGCFSTDSGNCKDTDKYKKGAPASKQYGNNGKKRIPGWAKALIIIALVILCIGFLVTGCNKLISVIGAAPSNEVTTGFGHDYIGTLYIEGSIDEYGTGTYNHQYILNAIDAMIYDDDNKGLILYINTPGGSVYASDEVYLKIKEYQELTGRPVYSSMQSQATSGGYYISAPCDKIIANRNCWTGSIGVTMGSFIDLSELLDNLGVKTETITSGDNKAMGSSTEPMTDEQRAIFQSLIDEAYEQFVGIVADGRNMTEAEVKELADGRIYTTKQALDCGLIDQIGTYSEAASDMMQTYGLSDCSVENFQPEIGTDLSSLLGLLQEESKQSGASITDAEAIEKLLELNGTFRVSYICNAVK